MKHKITHKFYLPETSELVDELPPDKYKAFLRDLIKEPIKWMREAARNGNIKQCIPKSDDSCVNSMARAAGE